MKLNKLSLSFLGASSMVAWFMMFGLGLFVNSAPYRDSVGKEFQVKAFFMSLLTYTPTNIATLTITAALCGGCAGSLLWKTKKMKQSAAEAEAEAANSWAEDGFDNPVTAIIRGFVVYIAFLGGVYIVTDQPFSHATPEQYARAAGTVSLLAFLVGFDQAVFKSLLSFGSGAKKK